MKMLLSDIPKPVLDRMAYLEERDVRDRKDGTPQLKRLRQVPAKTGMLLAILASSAPRGPVLEIGASGGYSALWLSLACKERGDKLVTYELLPDKAELAREAVRHKANDASPRNGSVALWAPVLLVAIISVASYAWLGRPDLPAAPLANRDLAAEGQDSLETAIEKIEKRLTEAPDDLRGWTVVAPAYMQLGRYGDAVRALRRVNVD